ncbi:MAG: hypothetical protein ACE5EH_06115 [Gammaproteobacteria bacterium]
MSHKEFLSALAIALTFLAFLPYIRSIWSGSVKPHVFSWITWGITTFIVFLAQVEGGGGTGAWPIGVSACITTGIAKLAYHKRTDITINATDWLFFVSAMTSIPLWYFTADPVWAVVILTLVDLLGFGPTVRKSWYQPHTESITFFSIFATRNIIVIAALENYSVTTTLFPVAIAIASILLVMLIIIRRHLISIDSK